MATPDLPGWSWAAIGAALVGAVRLVWAAIQKSTRGEVETLKEQAGYLKGIVAAKDERIEKMAEAHAARVEALEAKLEKKGEELTAIKERFAAHVIRTDDYADVPTGVHHLAVTLDPSKPTPR